MNAIRILAFASLLYSVSINADVDTNGATWLVFHEETLQSTVEKLGKYYPQSINLDDCIKRLRVTARVKVTTARETVGAVEFIADLMRLDVAYSEGGEMTLVPREGSHDCP